jgi:exopolyphosphatase/pppGpp-phosphohydrolase
MVNVTLYQKVEMMKMISNKQLEKIRKDIDKRIDKFIGDIVGDYEGITIGTSGTLSKARKSYVDKYIIVEADEEYEEE